MDQLDLGDPWKVRAALDLLASYGTEKSVSVLEALAAKEDGMVKIKAEEALKAIRLRISWKTPSGS